MTRRQPDAKGAKRGPGEELGGDIAWGVTVTKESLPQLLAAVRLDAIFQGQIGDVAPEDQLVKILPALSRQFDSFYDLKKWLQEHRIPFTKYTDPYA